MTLHRIFVAAVMVCGAVVSPAAAQAPAMPISASEAIARAVAERVRSGLRVQVVSVSTDVPPTRNLEALPDPGGRSGQPTRFVLTSGNVRVGSAVATVLLSGPYARSARDLGRGETIGVESVELVDGPLQGLPFRRLPEPGTIAGLTTRRAVRRGEPFTDAIVAEPLMIQAGDPVTAIVRIGSVEVAAAATAVAAGRTGDVIRVMQKGSRRLLSGRITGEGTVEILE